MARLASAAELRAHGQPGDYAPAHRLDDDGIAKVWYTRCRRGHVADLSDHQVTEHPDGTITVSPSVVCPEPGCLAHGVLDHGVWAWDS